MIGNMRLTERLRKWWAKKKAELDAMPEHVSLDTIIWRAAAEEDERNAAIAAQEQRIRDKMEDWLDREYNREVNANVDRSKGIRG